MLVTASLAALLAAGATTSFPGGTVDIPAGCTAPREISMVVDGFFGGVKCPKAGLDIFVYGDVYSHDPCGHAGSPVSLLGEPLPSPPRESVKISLPTGSYIVICTVEREAKKRGATIKEMLIDLGGAAQLTAEIQKAEHALLMLRVATSFRIASEQESK